MKRAVAIVLALSLALSLFGCAKKPEAREALSPVSPGTDGAAGVEPAKPEGDPVTWEYEVTTGTEADSFTNDDAVLLAEISYELPTLSVRGEGETGGQEPPGEMQAVCKAFNDGIAAYREELLDASELGAEAQMLYEEREPEYRADFFAFSQEVAVEKTYRRGDLLEVLLSDYGYWGGAHGGMAYVNLHFDLKTGEFFDLFDLTDRPDELREELAQNLLGKIWAQEESQYYYDDFDQIVLAKEEYNVSFGEEGMTVIFEQYEIAPYVMGILEYEVPYAEFSRFLNERGERLLALSPEQKALGDYYEAEEMWYWFEGGMPMDYEDVREVRDTQGDWNNAYYRVTIPGVTTLADLRAKLLTRFSKTVADQRLETATNAEFPLLREIDGALYAAPAGRGDDMYIRSVDFRAELNADGTGGKVVATIQWQDYDEQKEDWVLTDTSEVDFPFELGENGAVFSEFHTIW